MKIRSLLLGSAALAGLSTAGYAADLGVVTSLDVCDELGLSGLTISSDSNCLVITGKVKFEYDWGNYDPGFVYLASPNNTGNKYTVLNGLGVPDSNHGDVDLWLKFVGESSTDFGPATATIKLVSNNIAGTGNWNSPHRVVGIGEAWVGIGDTTQLMAGYKSSIFNSGDDVPLNYLGLFNSSSVNTGVGFSTTKAATGGDVIQVVSNLGNGLQVSGGLENLAAKFGTLTGVGVMSYAGDGISAHVSAAIGTDKAGAPPWGWKVHAGFTGAWDPIKVVGAVSADDTGYWDALGSVAATFDMFTLAASGEALAGGSWGVGGSAKATISDGVSLNLGGRFFHDTGTWDKGGPLPGDVYQVEAAISATVTEGITLTGAVGATDSTVASSHGLVFYGSGGVAWAPGGGFTSGASLTVNSIGGYKAVFTAAKDIK